MENNRIQEIQMLEQNLQNLMMQKQSFQFELSETQEALSELEKSDDEVFKIVGQLLIKSNKEKIKDELSNKEKLIELRVSSIEKQENSLSENLEKLRKEVLNKK
jgi:prefoldin beta subunit